MCQRRWTAGAASLSTSRSTPWSPNQCCSAVILEFGPSSALRQPSPSSLQEFRQELPCHIRRRECRNPLGDHVISGLLATNNIKRLEILNDEHHILSFSVVGNDHQLANYRSVTTLHPSTASKDTVPIEFESYVVDIPPDNTKEETCLFVDTVVPCSL